MSLHLDIADSYGSFSEIYFEFYGGGDDDAFDSLDINSSSLEMLAAKLRLSNFYSKLAMKNLGSDRKELQILPHWGFAPC